MEEVREIFDLSSSLTLPYSKGKCFRLGFCFEVGAYFTHVLLPVIRLQRWSNRFGTGFNLKLRWMVFKFDIEADKLD